MLRGKWVLKMRKRDTIGITFSNTLSGGRAEVALQRIFLFSGYSSWSGDQKWALGPIETNRNPFWDYLILKLRERSTVSSCLLNLG